MACSLDVLIGGRWLGSIAPVGDLSYSHAWPGGCRDASWVMTTRYSAHNATLVRGASVEIRCAAWPLWRGYLQEPEWNGRDVSLTAAGLYRLGEGYTALDGSNNPSDTPSTAITQAITHGLTWTLGAGIPTTSLATTMGGDPITTNTSLTALLDSWAEYLGQHWMVNAFGVVSMGVGPVVGAAVPDYVVLAGAGDLGIAEDNYGSNVLLRHATATGFRTAVYPPFGTVTAYERKYGHKERSFDITDRGVIADAAADSLAQAIYLRSVARPGWTNALEVAATELRSPGNAAVGLASVSAAKLLRIHGVPDEVALTPYTDVVLGGTEFKAGSSTITLSPVDLASRDIESVLTEALTAAGIGEAA